MKKPFLPLDTLPLLRYNTRMNKTPRMTRAHYNFLADFINDFVDGDEVMYDDMLVAATGLTENKETKASNNWARRHYEKISVKTLPEDPWTLILDEQTRTELCAILCVAAKHLFMGDGPKQVKDKKSKTDCCSKACEKAEQ